MALENKINIKTVDVSKVNFFIPLCYENALITYGDTVKLEFRTGFISAWDFNYIEKKDSEKMGETIFDNYNLLDSMSKYCNLHCKFVEISKVDELLEIIDSNLQKKLPTIIHIDSYYAPWSPIYGRTHTDHVGLVCDHNKEKKEIYIIDPGNSSEIKIINYDFLAEASKFYLCMDISNVTNKSKDFLKLYYFSNETKIKFITKIKDFAYTFKNKFSPVKEFENPNDVNNVLDSDMVIQIRKIIVGRNLFLVYLDSIKEEEKQFEKVIELLTVSISKWNMIINLFVKLAISGWSNNINEKIANILYNIAEIEERAYEWLLKYIEDFNYNEKFEIIVENLQSYPLDLTKYFNNKGFTEESCIQNLDFTQTGEYFIVLKQFCNERIQINDIEFKINIQKNLDNIVCLGQEIIVSTNKIFKGICILCASEWGSNYDDIIINSGDNNYDVCINAFNISIIDQKDSIYFGKTISADGKCINEKAALTFNKYLFNKGINIERISLPYSPNLHIIAITFLL